MDLNLCQLRFSGFRFSFSRHEEIFSTSEWLIYNLSSFLKARVSVSFVTLRDNTVRSSALPNSIFTASESVILWLRFFVRSCADLLVHSLFCLSACDSWDRLQPPCYPEISGRTWMDGYITIIWANHPIKNKINVPIKHVKLGWISKLKGVKLK